MLRSSFIMMANMALFTATDGVFVDEARGYALRAYIG